MGDSVLNLDATPYGVMMGGNLPTLSASNLATSNLATPQFWIACTLVILVGMYVAKSWSR
jgi:hypothetical protein